MTPARPGKRPRWVRFDETPAAAAVGFAVLCRLSSWLTGTYAHDEGEEVATSMGSFGHFVSAPLPAAGGSFGATSAFGRSVPVVITRGVIYEPSAAAIEEGHQAAWIEPERIGRLSTRRYRVG